jgi:hypothetical protein
MRGSPFAKLLKVALIVCSFGALTADADAIQKWRTPSGALYFGDRPPAGSTLVETFADSPRASSLEPSVTAADLSREAAEGRDIIRRREEERVAERQREAERERAEEQEASVEPVYGSPGWFVETSPPCVFGDCFDRFDRYDRYDRGGRWHRADRQLGPDPRFPTSPRPFPRPPSNLSWFRPPVTVSPGPITGRRLAPFRR